MPARWLLLLLLAPPQEGVALTPIPQGWHSIPIAVCAGRLAPSAGKGCVPDPTFPDQCIWPYNRTGFAQGAYAATQCAASPGCALPIPPHNAPCLLGWLAPVPSPKKPD